VRDLRTISEQTRTAKESQICDSLELVVHVVLIDIGFKPYSQRPAFQKNDIGKAVLATDVDWPVQTLTYSITGLVEQNLFSITAADALCIL
jgi:hypothetical protein